MQYVLFRVPIDAESYKQTNTTRDVFIMWTGTISFLFRKSHDLMSLLFGSRTSGPNVSIVQAGKKKSHVGEVKKILKPFHAELTAVNKDSFTLENVIGTSSHLPRSRGAGILISTDICCSSKQPNQIRYLDLTLSTEATGQQAATRSLRFIHWQA